MSISGHFEKSHFTLPPSPNKVPFKGVVDPFKIFGCGTIVF